MVITALDTHQTIKDLTAAGFTDAQAEAVTQLFRQVQQIDLSDLASKADLAALERQVAAIRAEMATKADLAMLRAELEGKMAEMKAELIKWVVGVGFAQLAAILAILKPFPSGHP